MSRLPEFVHLALMDQLNKIGDGSPILEMQPVGGGCINHAMRLETGIRTYFFKWNHPSPAQMFHKEASALALLASTQTVTVPSVWSVYESATEDFGLLLLEWLEGKAAPDSIEQLGVQLADLHRRSYDLLKPSGYGFDSDNFLGRSPQINTWERSWGAFFANSRILPQMDMAYENGRLPGPRRRKLEKFLDRLPQLLNGVTRQPSLIHGDLWSGNVIESPAGLVLIDPAVSFSDREAEIAYTELFGGFGHRFYQAYQNTWPLEKGYSERRDLYNLYHLLNHLNLFGESYGSAVDAVLNHYVGFTG
jgi:fructosamine-3-kinase